MKKIPLTQGQYAIVDNDDFIELSKYKWFADFCSETKSFYAKRGVNINGKRTTVRMHRIIMDTPRNMVIDHINHQTLDNRKSNLRVCTRSQNAKNYSKPINNSTGYKGLKYHERLKKWESRLVTNGKYKYLGLFFTKEDAARAYDEASLKYNKEFANLNFNLKSI